MNVLDDAEHFTVPALWKHPEGTVLPVQSASDELESALLWHAWKGNLLQNNMFDTAPLV